jgi:protoporphyrinogen oxidase
MRAYNEKIWQYPLNDIEIGWIQGKMPLPDKKEILRSIVLRNNEEHKWINHEFYYPMYGGIQSIYDVIAKPLSIKLGCSVESIERNNRKWCVNGEGFYDKIISTVPVVEMPALLGNMPETVNSAINQLKFNGLNTVLFSCKPTDIHWMYIPENKYKSNRVMFPSACTPHATPDPKIGSGVLEITGKQIDIPDGFIHQGAIPDEIQADKQIAIDYIQYAYVIHNKGYAKNTAIFREYFNELEDFQIIGRWSVWHYPNMFAVIEQSLELVDEHYPDTDVRKT